MPDDFDGRTVDTAGMTPTNMPQPDQLWQGGASQEGAVDSVRQPAALPGQAPDTPDPAAVDAALAWAKLAVTGDDEWRAGWKAFDWPDTAPPNGSLTTQSVDVIKENIRTLAAAVRELRHKLDVANRCFDHELAGKLSEADELTEAKSGREYWQLHAQDMLARAQKAETALRLARTEIARRAAKEGA